MNEPPSPPADTCDLTIRATRFSDAEEIASISNLPGYRWGTLRLPYTSVEDIRKFLENRPVGHIGLVATRSERIVGIAGLETFSGRRSHAGYLGMGVHDDHVGTGVGTALLKALVDTAENWMGLRRIELTVYVDNGPAIALYRRHGFEVEGAHRNYALRDGALIDALAMARVTP
jgi:L-phenylalanine/L-methionine N-acetyltransferase